MLAVKLSYFKQLAPIWSPQLLRMSAIVLDLDSKGRLSAFGRVSFVTFLWRNKEKSFQYASMLLRIVIASARPVFQYAFRLLQISIASARPVSAC